MISDKKLIKYIKASLMTDKQKQAWILILSKMTPKEKLEFLAILQDERKRIKKAIAKFSKSPKPKVDKPQEIMDNIIKEKIKELDKIRLQNLRSRIRSEDG